jgi:putative solute:sodium symporter small subunit
MIERKERKPYWRHTKRQMLRSLLPFLLTLIVLPVYADRLNNAKILGFPAGYFLVCHGLIVIGFVTVISFVNRQDAIDRWHGANEDM